MATITVRQNGPYRVDGDDVKVVDWNGNEYQIPKRPFALCRCGASKNKPFCDRTHSEIGFQAAEAAVPGSVDKPAI
jgi:CDGSH-type Zn-finger protein